MYIIMAIQFIVFTTFLLSVYTAETLQKWTSHCNGSPWGINLIKADFSGMHLRALPPNTLGQNVVHLMLDYNLLDLLPSAAFHTYPNITYLNLSHNLLRHIDVDAFYGIPQLQVLDLSYNHLETFSDETFGNMQCLKLLNLSSNSIIKLSPKLFYRIPRPFSLNIIGNVLNCYHMCWLNFEAFIGSVASRQIKIIGSIQCAGSGRFHSDGIGFGRNCRHWCNEQIEFTSKVMELVNVPSRVQLIGIRRCVDVTVTSESEISDVRERCYTRPGSFSEFTVRCDTRSGQWISFYGCSLVYCPLPSTVKNAVIIYDATYPTGMGIDCGQGFTYQCRTGYSMDYPGLAHFHCSNDEPGSITGKYKYLGIDTIALTLPVCQANSVTESSTVIANYTANYTTGYSYNTSGSSEHYNKSGRSYTTIIAIASSIGICSIVVGLIFIVFIKKKFARRQTPNTIHPNEIPLTGQHFKRIQCRTLPAVPPDNGQHFKRIQRRTLPVPPDNSSPPSTSRTCVEVTIHVHAFLDVCQPQYDSWDRARLNRQNERHSTPQLTSRAADDFEVLEPQRHRRLSNQYEYKYMGDQLEQQKERSITPEPCTSHPLDIPDQHIIRENIYAEITEFAEISPEQPSKGQGRGKN